MDSRQALNKEGVALIRKSELLGLAFPYDYEYEQGIAENTLKLKSKSPSPF